MKPSARRPAPARPPSGGGAFALEAFLPYRLSVLTNTVSRAFGALYGARFGITIPEWRILAVLGRFAQASQTELCRRTAMDKVQVSRAVARLAAAGLVAREREAHDRRHARLRLSPSGRRRHDAIVPMAREIERRLLGGMTQADRRRLDRLLTRLSAHAATLAPAGLRNAAPPD